MSLHHVTVAGLRSQTRICARGERAQINPKRSVLSLGFGPGFMDHKRA